MKPLTDTVCKFSNSRQHVRSVRYGLLYQTGSVAHCERAVRGLHLRDEAVFRQYTMTDLLGDVVSNHKSLSGSSRVATPHQFLSYCWTPMDLGAALGASGTSRYEVSLGKAAMAVSIQRRAD
jgi:hypothetical protein